MQISYLFFDAKKKIGQITVVLWRTRKRRKIFRAGKYLYFRGEGKGGKYLEKEEEDEEWRRKTKPSKFPGIYCVPLILSNPTKV